MSGLERGVHGRAAFDPRQAELLAEVKRLHIAQREGTAALAEARGRLIASLAAETLDRYAREAVEASADTSERGGMARARLAHNIQKLPERLVLQVDGILFDLDHPEAEAAEATPQ